MSDERRAEERLPIWDVVNVLVVVNLLLLFARAREPWARTASLILGPASMVLLVIAIVQPRLQQRRKREPGGAMQNAAIACFAGFVGLTLVPHRPPWAVVTALIGAMTGSVFAVAAAVLRRRAASRSSGRLPFYRPPGNSS